MADLDNNISDGNGLASIGIMSSINLTGLDKVDFGKKDKSPLAAKNFVGRVLAIFLNRVQVWILFVFLRHPKNEKLNSWAQKSPYTYVSDLIQKLSSPQRHQFKVSLRQKKIAQTI